VKAVVTRHAAAAGVAGGLAILRCGACAARHPAAGRAGIVRALAAALVKPLVARKAAICTITRLAAIGRWGIARAASGPAAVGAADGQALPTALVKAAVALDLTGSAVAAGVAVLWRGARRAGAAARVHAEVVGAQAIAVVALIRASLVARSVFSDAGACAQLLAGAAGAATLPVFADGAAAHRGTARLARSAAVVRAARIDALRAASV
jgi:hypothetical protein